MKRIFIGFFITLFMVSISFGLPTQDHIGLTWDAPTTNVDGSALKNLVGYKVYWKDGLSSSSVYEDTNSFQVIGIENTSVLYIDISNLPLGALDFTVTAYDTSGNESDYSNQVTHIPLVVPVAPSNTREQ